MSLVKESVRKLTNEELLADHIRDMFKIDKTRVALIEEARKLNKELFEAVGLKLD